MSENNVNQVQPASAQVPAQEPKRVRVGFIFLSFVPVAVLLVIQTISQMPFIAIAFAEAMEEAGGNIPDYVDLIIKMSEVFNAKYAVWSYLLYAVIGLIVFGTWYIKGFVKGKPRFKFSKVFGFKSILASVGIVIGLTLTLVHLFGLPFTGTSVNPARSLAPAILQGGAALSNVWIFILAPIIGAILAGLFYKYVLKEKSEKKH